MPRTPLMRALVRVAADHREADRRGVTPADVRADRELTRREFLVAGAAAGAALSTLGALRPSAARAASSPRIAIVGAGIAGLNACLALADSGLDSTVYEASNRVGGRMHSDATTWAASGQTSEWCGELIDQGHKTILSLAQRFHLPTANLLAGEPNRSEDTYRFFGRYYTQAQADGDFQPVHQALQRDVAAASYPTTYLIHTSAGIALDNMSVYQWIESRVPGGHSSSLGQLLDVAYNIEYGAETSDQSALNLVYLLGYHNSPGNFAIFGASNEKYHIIGGNQQLPEAMAEQLGAKIQRRWAMTSLKRNKDGTVGLTFSTPMGTKSVTADYAILALPFAVLSTLNYRGANFDPLKVQAITQLGRGRNDKLQLQFDTRFWDTAGAWPGIGNGNSYADTGYQNTWDVTRSQPGTPGILVNYTGGDTAGAFTPSIPYSTAADNPQVIAYAQTFLSQIESVYPGLSRHWTGRASLSVPLLDPNLNTSYSYWKVGQYHTFAGYEGVRQGNILFAGEHCSQDFQGFMEGGAAEGARAAGEILSDLKRA
ncbi:MAG: monoamine oxidase [bacterium]